MPENSLEVTLESIGLSLDQMDSYMISIKTGIGNFDRQICICGHPMARHERSGEFSSCTVSKSWCACSAPLPVLEAERIKPFRFASTGFGQKHALSKGVIRRPGLLTRCALNVKQKMFRYNLLHFLKLKK